MTLLNFVYTIIMLHMYPCCIHNFAILIIHTVLCVLCHTSTSAVRTYMYVFVCVCVCVCFVYAV